MSARKPFFIAGVQVAPGETQDIRMKISETYTGDSITIPMRVSHAAQNGPRVFVSAAVHGDELNGTGIIHELMFDKSLQLQSGTLLLIPVVNVFGFENNERYLPDRRDLNRAFPGRPSGTLASRIAATFTREVILQCDYGIDLHSAGAYRTNFPNVRGNLKLPAVRRIAEAFGCELILDVKGPAGSLRRAACNKRCATIILEAGEIFKIEPKVVKVGVTGIKNVLTRLKMLQGTVEKPLYQIKVRKFKWVRASVGGILKCHIKPGEIVTTGQPLATNFDILGERQKIIKSPDEGVILSVVTAPTVKPGDPVCHIAIPEMGTSVISKTLNRAKESGE